MNIMKIKNKRILALLSTAAFVVVAGTMSSKADETTDKQAYLDGTRRELVGGYQMPPDVTGVTRTATLVSGSGNAAVFDINTTITDATNADYVAAPYSVPFVNSGVNEVPYLDGVADTRDIVINMEGGNVGALYGTYVYSDVTAGKITHNISGGNVGTLIGGANMTDSTNALPAYSPGQVSAVEINVSGGTVGQIRGGNTTSEGEAAGAHNVGTGGITINVTGGTVGQAGQQDAIRGAGGSFDGVDGKVSINISGDATQVIGDVYAGARRATVDSTEVSISGGEITGNVYGGGMYHEGAAVVTNDTKVTISGGTIHGDVYAAGMNDQVGGSTSIVLVGDSAQVLGTLNGGSDNSAAVAAGTVGGEKSIDFGTADTAYTGTVRLADFTAVNVNNGSTTLESLTNAAEGTSITVAQNGTLNTQTGVINGVESLAVQGGTLNVDMNGSNGTALTGKSLTFADGSTINVLNVGDDAEGVTVFGFDDVDSAENLTVTLNGGTVSSQLWNMEDGVLYIRELSASTLSLSPNQRRFYAVLQEMKADGTASQELAALVESRDEGAVKAALNALSGHEYATAMSSQIDGNMGHLRRLRASMGMGHSLGRTTTYVENGMVDEKGMSLASPMEVTDVRRWRVGVQGFYAQTKVDADSHGDGYDRAEAGGLLVAEYMASDTATMGVALSYGRTSLDTDHSARRHEDNTRLDVYSLYGVDRWTFATSLGMGLHTHDMKRWNAHSSDADGYSINFMHEVAYRVMQTESATVQLFGAVQTSWNHMDSVRERGGVAPLYMRDQDAWATDVLMGARYSMQLTPWNDAPAGLFMLQAGATGSVGDVNPAVKLRMDGYDYRQECAQRDRWGWEIGVGLDVPVSNTVSLFGTAECIFRGDSHSVDGQVGVRVAF